MLFSIIMPFYNVEDYLAEAIESVLEQTYSHFELIIVNDGSTDNSLTIAQNYLVKDPRVQLISQKNQGQSTARNAGIKLAKGDYIYFMDSDDWILKETLQEVHEKLKIKKYDVVCFTAEAYVPDTFSKTEKEEIEQEILRQADRAYLSQQEYSVSDFLEQMYNHNNFVPMPVLYVIKHELIQKNNLLFFDGIIYEDNLYIRELFLHAKNIYFIPKRFYKIRHRLGSTTRSKVNERKPFSFLIMSEQLYFLSLKHPENPYLLMDSHHFFNEAIKMIINDFKNSKALKQQLFALQQKLQLKRYKYIILELKYPYLKYLFLIELKLKQLIKRIFFAKEF